MKTIFFKNTLLLFIAIILTTYADTQAQTFTDTGNLKVNRLRIQGDRNGDNSYQRGLVSQHIHFDTNIKKWSVGDGTYNDFAMMKFNNNGSINFYTREYVGGSYTLTNNVLENTYKRMTILNNGNVGVGTPNPGGKLTVKSAAGLRGLESLNPSGNSHFPWTDGRAYLSGTELVFRTDGNTERMRITTDGNVGIGTNTPGTFKLAVNGTIRAKEIIVEEGWGDYVFYDNYQLPTLEDEEEHIEENGHLLGFESAEDMANEIQLGDVSKRQQVKIEEIMLHLIEMNKQFVVMKAKIDSLEKENAQLKEQPTQK